MKKENFTAAEAAAELSVTHARINFMLRKDYFPHAHLCECGRSHLIPLTDIQTEKKRRKASEKSNLKKPR